MMPTRCQTRRPEIEQLEDRNLLSWTPLSHVSPGTGTGTMLLMTDGSVLVQGDGITASWYKLTPDAAGSYVNGTWATVKSMNTARLYFASTVLKSGKVFVLGGEYSGSSNTANWTNTGEIYDPVANTWTKTKPFPQTHYGDDTAMLLSGGNVLLSYLSGPQTYVYNPNTNTYAAGGSKLRNEPSDEETWVRLPDGSILSYDLFNAANHGNSTAQRYIPSTATWVDAGTLPVSLTDNAGFEMGPGFVLSTGKAFYVGSTGTTAIYTESTNSWVAGPSLPTGMGADDAPGAMMVNGNVMFAADTPQYSAPTKLFNYNPFNNSLVTMTTPAALTNVLNQVPSYVLRMLQLPTGQVLLTDSTTHLWVYTPGPALAAGIPTIASVTSSSGTYTLTGTKLNGLSAGASYGDDAQMDSNYPIVRLVDSTGTKVYYARTFNWSMTGIRTLGATETVNFTLPSGLPSGSYSLYEVANGIPSVAFSLTVPGPAVMVLTRSTEPSSLLQAAPPGAVSGGSQEALPASARSEAILLADFLSSQGSVPSARQESGCSASTHAVDVIFASKAFDFSL
jgi:hypothetical protein